MSFIAVGVGVGAMAGGAYLQGQEGRKKRRTLQNLAHTPGLDIDQITGQALTNQGKHLGAASELARTEATQRQATVNQLLEQSLPGFTAQRDNAMATANDFLGGELPDDITSLIQRKGAAQALGGGYGGSGMHQNLVARDFGLTSLNLRDKGLAWLQALRGMSPTVTPQSGLALAGPGANDLLNIRGQERAQRMNLLAQRAGVPGASAAWGNFLSQVGGVIAGAGMQGMMGGMGGGAKPSGGPPPGTVTTPWASYSPNSVQAIPGGWF